MTSSALTFRASIGLILHVLHDLITQSVPTAFYAARGSLERENHKCQCVIHLALFVYHLCMLLYSSKLTCVVAYDSIDVIIVQSNTVGYMTFPE